MLQEWIMKKSLSKSNMEKNVEGAAGRGIGLFCLYWNVAGYHSRYVPVDKGGKAELTGVRASRIGGVKQTLTWEWEVRHKKWETSNSSQLNLGQNFGRSYNKSWLVFCCPAAIVTYLTFLISQLSILSLIFFFLFWSVLDVRMKTTISCIKTNTVFLMLFSFQLL